MLAMTSPRDGDLGRPVRTASSSEELGELLSALKQRSGRSYEWIGRKVNAGRSTVQRYCTGQSVPVEFGTIERVARVCGADGDEIARLFRLWETAASISTSAGIELPTAGGDHEHTNPVEGVEYSTSPVSLVPPALAAADDSAPRPATQNEHSRLRGARRAGWRWNRRSISATAIIVVLFSSAVGTVLVLAMILAREPGVRPLGRPLADQAGWALSTAFSPDGKVMASSSRKGGVWLWNMADPATPVRIDPALTGPRDGVTSLAFSPDGSLLAGGSWDGSIWLWDITDSGASKPAGRALTDDSGPIWSVAFSADGRTLASGSDDTTVRLWDMTNRARPWQFVRLSSDMEFVTSVAFSADNRLLVAAGFSRTIAIWDMADRGAPKRLAQSLSTPATTYVAAFSPNGRLLATGSTDGLVRLWDLAVPEDPHPIGRPLTGHTNRVWSLAFSPDGGTLASSGFDNSVRLWDVTDLSNPEPIGAPLTGYQGWVLSVRFSPNGRVLASTSSDSTIRLWSLP